MKTVSSQIAGEMYKQVLSGRNSFEVFEKTKTVLEKRGQKNLYAHALKILQKRLSDKKRFETVVIKTPFEICSGTEQSIISKIGLPTEADREQIIDPSLLAGFTAVHKGTLFDASAKRILKAITRNK